MAPIKRLEESDMYQAEKNEMRKAQLILLEHDKDITEQNEAIEKLNGCYEMAQKQINKNSEKLSVDYAIIKRIECIIDRLEVTVTGFREDMKSMELKRAEDAARSHENERKFYKRVFWVGAGCIVSVAVAAIWNLVGGGS